MDVVVLHGGIGVGGGGGGGGRGGKRPPNAKLGGHCPPKVYVCRNCMCSVRSQLSNAYCTEASAAVQECTQNFFLRYIHPIPFHTFILVFEVLQFVAHTITVVSTDYGIECIQITALPRPHLGSIMFAPPIFWWLLRPCIIQYVLTVWVQ